MTTYSVSGPTVVLVGNGTDQYGNLLVADCTDPITGARGPVIVKITNTSNSAVASLQWGDGTVPTYYFDNVSGTGGTGSNATFDFTVTSSNYSATVDSGGAGYTPGDTITVLGTYLGGAAPTNNATVTVVTADVLNAVANIGNLSGGTNYTTGVDIPTTGGNGTGFEINIVNTTPIVNGVVGFNNGTLVPGTGYTTGTGYATTTDGIGVGCTVNINASPIDAIASFDNTTLVPGTGYPGPETFGVSTTTSGSGTGATVEITSNPVDGVATLDNTTLTGGATYGPFSVSGPLPWSATGNIATTTNGSGIGCQLNVTAFLANTITALDNATLYGGSGYPGTGTNVATENLTRFIPNSGKARVDFTSTGGSVDTVTVVYGGSGYEAGDVLEIQAGSPFDRATIEVLTVGGNGEITSVNSVHIAGNYYAPGDILYLVGGDNNASIEVLTTSGLGEILTVAINNQGNNYQVGDTIFITGGNNDASIDVLTIVGNGEITSVSVQTSGTDYQVGDTIFVTGGNNDGSIEISDTNIGGVIDQVSLSSNLGQNYQVGDVLTITGGLGDATVEVTEVTLGGQIQTVSVTGTQLWPQTTIQQTYMAPGSTEYVQINGQTAVDSFFIGNAASGVIYITPVTIVG